MRTALFVAALLAVPAVCAAQDVHPGSESGKLLSMEQVILSRDIQPGTTVMPKVREELAKCGIPFSDKPGKYQEVLEGQSLYYKGADGLRHPVAISNDPAITYGRSVSRNEFGISSGCFWSPDSTALAFYRKDESLVTEFPLLDITTRTGSLRSIKYPMNGMDSERISLGVFNISQGSTIYLDVNDFGPDRYITNVTWGPDGKYLFAQVLDRSQKHCRLNMYRASDGSFVRTLLSEDNDKYVEPQDPLYFIPGGYLFVYRTANRDGFQSLYLCDTLGTVRRITPVDADVQMNAIRSNSVFYTSAEVSPVQNHLFRVDIRQRGTAARSKIGKPVRLTWERGWHTVNVSTDGKWLLDRNTSLNLPMSIELRSVDGKEVLFSHRAPDPLAEYATGSVELGTVPSADGLYENWYRLIKPVGFDPSKKYPVIVYVYGGPHSQMVNDSWLGQIRLWEMYMAQRGYVVWVQDNRGTQNRGLAFEQAIHRHCGQAEMADQMKGVEYLLSQPWVDASRIGVHGWSYGGFMTVSLMTNYPDVFKVGVAGGPVIDWKWYEVMYGERYMETEATNPEGFAQTSLIGKAKDLRGKLLICQGAIDNTVVWEHSLSFVQECIKNWIPVDYFPYPTAEHNVFGRDRVHLMDKVSQYFFDYLE